MAYAYVIVIAGKILEFLPIHVTDEEPKRNREEQLEQKDRVCSICEVTKPQAEFYNIKGFYCKE